MKLRDLVEHRILTEGASKCGIFNALLKYRPDLEDEMRDVPGLDAQASTAFLKKHGLWDERAEVLFESFLRWNMEYNRGPDEWSFSKKKESMDRLMTYVARLIKNSASASAA